MEKSALGLIAALGAMLPMTAANAAVTPEEAHRVIQPTSVSDLLEPIPDALRVINALAAEPKIASEGTQVTQLYFGFGHHHHHHNHYYHHHHHHHHYWHHHNHHYYDDNEE